MKRWQRQCLYLGAAFIAGGLAAMSFLQTNSAPLQRGESRELFDVTGQEYPLINPILSCGDHNEQTPGKIRALKEQIQSFVSAQEQTGNITDFSMYYRELNNGPWFGINFEKKFTPGSLLKLPLLMSILKQFEMDPTLASKKLVLTGDIGKNQLIPPAHPIEVGASYTYDELLSAMISDSDNNAAYLLYENSDQNLYDATFRDLGIDPPVVGSDYTIDVRTYGSFFRILYNSTLLSRASSQKALDLLVHVNYKDGLVAGVPASVRVAHKFGEREVGTSDVVQLHDCGIVYAEHSPYLICIMTRGNSLTDLQSIIARVSQMVYETQHTP